MANRITRIRFWVQLGAAFLFNSYLAVFWNGQKIYTGVLKQVSFPVLNCYASPSAIFSCPAGSLQHFSAIRAFPYYIVSIFFLTGATVGRFFCGWACPFGFFQDILKRFARKRVALPKFLSYSKYLFLIGLVLIIPFVTGDPWFCRLCPQGTLEGGLPQVILHPEIRAMIGFLFSLKLIILSVLIVVSIFVPRFFCRFVCPIGAGLALFNKVSILQLRVQRSLCNNCGQCRRICPTDLAIYENETDQDCVRCLACTFCPAVKVGTIFESTRFEKPEQIVGSGRDA